MTKRKRPPNAPPVMDEQALRGEIKKLKSRIASQQHEFSRLKGHQKTNAAQAFLAQLEAKLRYFEADLARLKDRRND